MMNEERAQFVSVIEDKNHQIGRLETQLQIVAPTEHEKEDASQDWISQDEAHENILPEENSSEGRNPQV